MPFTFSSRDGQRSQGVFQSREQALEAKRSDPDFRDHLRRYLGPRCRLVRFESSTVSLRAEFFPYYDMSLGCHVSSYAEKRRIQAERGLQDYQVIKGHPRTDKMRREGRL